MLAIAASVTPGDPNAVVEATLVPTAADATTTALEAVPTATTVTAAASCTVSTTNTVNLRSGAGTQFERAGTLDAGSSPSVVGQATTDGFVWWKLDSGSWVRSDVVQESGDCTAAPTVGA